MTYDYYHRVPIKLTKADSVALSKLHGKSVLVLGATGIIGRALEHILTDFSTGLGYVINVTLAGKSSPLRIPEARQNLSRVYGDVGDQNFIAKLSKYDFVILGAGYGQPAEFERDRSSTILVNTSSVIELSKHAREGVLFLSTSEIYSGYEGEVSEDSPCLVDTRHPRAAYIYSKLVGEIATMGFGSSIRANIARIALAYGPGFRGSDRRVLYDFVRKGLTLGRIDLLDEGVALRTYGFATDTALDLINVMVFGDGRAYNVGGASKLSIAELAYMVAEETGAEVSLGEYKSDSSAPKEVSLDLSRINQLRGEREYVEMAVGVEAIVTWAQSSELYTENEKSS
jgi:dTDP-glucose 4,6-dehydratase/UDP-glucuronate decarboxylase